MNLILAPNFSEPFLIETTIGTNSHSNNFLSTGLLSKNWLAPNLDPGTEFLCQNEHSEGGSKPLIEIGAALHRKICPKKLFELKDAWQKASSVTDKKIIWHKMLDIYTKNVFSIGIIASVPQVVLANKLLKNVPEKAICLLYTSPSPRDS